MAYQKKRTELQKFLSQRKVEKGEEYTHNSLWDKKLGIGYAGCFNIPLKDKEEFYHHYHKAVFIDGEDVFLAEKHQKLSPFVIDIDLRHELVNGEIKRIYDDKFIKDIVKLYFSYIYQYLDFQDNIQRYAFVFEKSQPILHTENVVKDGIHIMFPYLQTESAIQYLVREKVLESCQEILDRYHFLNSADDIFDECVIEKNSWLMYGSKKPGKEPYKLTAIYDTLLQSNIVKKITDMTLYTDEYLVKKLSIQDHMIETAVKKDKQGEILEMKDKKRRKKRINQHNNNKVQKENIPVFDNTEPPDDIDIIFKYVDILSPKRAESYNDWIRVGWCLHNIWNGSEMLDKWIDFSKKASQYTTTAENDCCAEWCKMRDEGLNLGTLRLWCRQDNPFKYEEIRYSSLSELVSICSKSNLPTTYDIANVVYKMYKEDFACISSKNKTWYEFRNHLWIESDNGINLRKRISNEVVNIFSKYAGDYNKKYSMIGGEDNQKNDYGGRAKRLTDISIKLRDINYKKKILEECSELFYKERFYDKLDSNPNLLGFKNGVYDLSTHSFRIGNPDDYVSYSTNIEYKEYDINDPVFMEIENFVSQVLPNKKVKDYVLTLLSSFLSGQIDSELFHIWTGSGGNGKSKLIELFELGLGSYSCKLPITVLTRKRAQSNQATPELARTKGKRFACLQEPDEDERIQVGLMKELTGGDTIQARALNQAPIEFKPQFHMLLTCNQLPKVPSQDGGTWRRMRVVHFTSKFVPDPDPNDPHQFKMDSQLSHKLKVWAQPFMWLLLNKYFKYYKLGDPENGIPKGLNEPEEVKISTNNYRIQNDVYAEFIDEMIVESPKSVLNIQDIYSLFKLWYKDSYTEYKCPSKKELKTYFENKYAVGGQKCKGKYKGITLRNVNDNQEQEEEEDLLE